MFFEVPASYVTSASSFNLYALDFTVDQWPNQPLPVVAVLPPTFQGSYTYFLELRRSAGYDAGIRKIPTDTSRPPAGIVIHYFEPVRKRIVYVDTLPLGGSLDDIDLHVFDGHFAFRVNRIGRDLQYVNLTVGGGDFWRNFGINIENVTHDISDAGTDAWQKANVSPCFMFPVESYQFRYKYTHNSFGIIAASYGYEKPGYIWKINDTELDPQLSSANITVDARTPQPSGRSPTTSVAVPFQYIIYKNSISLRCDPRVADSNFNVRLGVKVVETSPELIKNFYEDKSTMVPLHFANVALEWDSNYIDKVNKCGEAIRRVESKRQPVPVPRRPTPEPGLDQQILPDLETVIKNLVNTNPAVANSVIDEVSRMANINKIDVIKRLEATGR